MLKKSLTIITQMQKYPGYPFSILNHSLAITDYAAVVTMHYHGNAPKGFLFNIHNAVFLDCIIYRVKQLSI
jgi:hypothetical protein